MKRILLLWLLLWPALLSAQTEIRFINPIPESYNPAFDVPQYADILPDISLPTDHVYNKTVLRDTWNTALTMRKGVTHWHAGNANDDGVLEQWRADPVLSRKEYNGVPRIRELFNLQKQGQSRWHKDGYDLSWWPNGPLTYEQARERANSYPITPRVLIAETGEGEEWVPANTPMFRGFWETLRNRYESQKAQDGIPYFMAANYFTWWPDWFNLGYKSKAEHESLYDMPVERWPENLYLGNGSLSACNTVVEAVYLGVPDLSNTFFMQAIFKMDLARRAGKYTGLFVFAQHEWWPGYSSSIKYPGEGVFYRKDKLPIDPNILITAGFLAHEYGNLYIDWGLGGRTPASKKPVGYYPEMHAGGDRWYPEGSTSPQPFPWYNEHHGLKTYPNSFMGDISHFGVHLWATTGGQVNGGTKAYCTYRIDGSDWIQRTKNGSDLVRAYFEPDSLKKGVLGSRILGNKMLVYYFNLWADNQEHQIEFKHPTDPTKVYKAAVFGNGIHAALIEL